MEFGRSKSEVYGKAYANLGNFPNEASAPALTNREDMGHSSAFAKRTSSPRDEKKAQ